MGQRLRGIGDWATEGQEEDSTSPKHGCQVTGTPTAEWSNCVWKPQPWEAKVMPPGPGLWEVGVAEHAMPPGQRSEESRVTLKAWVSWEILRAG